jgi:hypothetical protein
LDYYLCAGCDHLLTVSRNTGEIEDLTVVSVRSNCSDEKRQVRVDHDRGWYETRRPGSAQ